MSETEMITGCVNGEERAYQSIYKEYKTYLYSACMRYVRNKYDAEDIIQEAMISVFRHIGDFRGDCQFKNWLYKITMCKAIDHYNKEKKESLYHIAVEDYLPLEKGEHGFEERYLASDELKKAMRILQKTAPAQYTFFRLYAIEGLNHREIAEDLEIPEGTSKSSVSRARVTLQLILKSINDMKRPDFKIIFVAI